MHLTTLWLHAGWFEQQLHKLPPAGWDAQPESVIAGSGLLAKLNVRPACTVSAALMLARYNLCCCCRCCCC